jgi:hypothetical protein
MNWYYAAGGRQQGPVDDAQLDAMLQSGQVNQDTLLWRDGMANWQPLRQARPSADAPPFVAPAADAGASAGVGEIVCVECGKIFSKDNAIQYGTAWVCAACKPIFLQKLREGAAVGGALQSTTGTYVDPDTLLAQVTSRDCSVDVGNCIARAFGLLKENFWLLVGATSVVLICQMVAGSIPILGYCTGPILQGPLVGGLYLLYLKLKRKEGGEFGDAFSGFSNFVQLMLASVVTTAIYYLFFIPAGVCFFMYTESKSESMMIASIAMGLLVLPGVAYLTIAWQFTFLLMVDKKLTFWTAMNVSRKVINKCWWGMLGLVLVVGLLQIVGFLAFCVGIFVSMTLIFGSIVYAYDDIFRGK